MKYHIEKNTVQETLIIPLYARKVCSEHFPTLFEDAEAAFRAADRNPYSWNMEFYEYADGSGYEARFTKCGICTLLKELEIYELAPAMCRLDYTMSEAGGVTDFVREYTIASGGPYCDSGYRKKAAGVGANP